MVFFYDHLKSRESEIREKLLDRAISAVSHQSA